MAAAGENQKLKLFYLYDILKKRTDEDHSITMSEIIKALDACGVRAERKAIYTDIQALNRYGEDIVGEKDGKGYNYRLVSRDFEMAELKLLVDSVQSSKFITEKKTRELIEKLGCLTSVGQAKQLNREVYISNRMKAGNEKIYYNIDGIFAAMEQDVQAAFRYAEIDDLFARAAEKGEDPFFVLLDQIEDPHNLGAIIRTANLAGAHGVIIPKDRSVGLTATAAKASAGAIHYTPVVKVTNLARTMEDLKKRGLWFVCADMDGTPMTQLSMTGPIGLVIGAEGSGVSRLVREKCDMTASIPMKGEIDSLNASVAAGVLMYEILRQRG